MAVETLHEEVNLFMLQVSWTRTKVQVFGGLLDKTVPFVLACCKDDDILENCSYIGSIMENNGGTR